MPKHFPPGQCPRMFLTGVVQTGKSTVIDRALARLPFSVGGIRTKRIPAGEDRATYILEDVISGVTVKFAESDPSGMKVDTEVFETAGVQAIRRSLEEADLTLLDELGRMEREAGRFQQQVFAALEGHRRVLGVIKAEKNAFLDAVRAFQGIELLEVTRDNRDGLVDTVVEGMMGGIAP